MEKSIKLFKQFPKISLAPLLSPIERCPNLTKHINGMPELYVKRDDFIGSLVWGNKLRKLEYSFAEAKRSGADTIITCGGVQSNHARITAQTGVRMGFKVILVLNGEKPAKNTANFLINSLLDIEIHFVPSREARAVKMAEIAFHLSRQGRKAYEIPLGASNEAGTPGFVNAFGELMEQQKQLGFAFDHIIHSSSSGGTQAGLEVGKRLFGQTQTKIIGISADNSAEEISQSVMLAANPVIGKLQMGNPIKTNDLNIDTDFVGPGYGIASEQSLRAAALFAKYEGVLVDQTYTGKAAAAIIDYAEKGKFKKTDKVLFWHTGGLINLF